MLMKKLVRCTASTLTRNLSTRPRPFPVLQDTIDVSCPQLVEGKTKAEGRLAELQQLNAMCLAGGGEKGIALHVKRNRKMLVRDKLKHILDDDTDFLEFALLAGLGQPYGDVPSAAAICGIGKIHGRYSMVIANDGTVKSGTFYPITVRKLIRAQELGEINRLPCIYLVDSAGGFLPLQHDLFADKKHGGRGFYNPAVMSSKGIPQLAVVCGSCTAGGAYQPSMCEDAAIVTRIGTIFLGGPPLVKAATGEEISSEDLGGATVHCSVSGVTDYFAQTEEESFEVLRDLVTTLNLDPVEVSPEAEDPLLDASTLNDLSGIEAIDRKKLYGVIARIVDGGRFREFKQQYGKNLTSGYAFIEGRCVGVIANAGPLSYQDGLKGSHFLQICQQRKLPVIFLQNSGPLPFYESSVKCLTTEESYQAIKGRVAMMGALSCITVPKIAINIGNCHADDNYTMCGPSFSPNFIFSWPGTTVTHTLNPPCVPLPAKPTESSGAGGKDKKKPRSLSAFNFPVGSSFYMAAESLIDGIIVPSDTRKVVAKCLQICRQQESLVNSSKDFPVFRL
ncbi:methylcrotonoyl-CoA carboxylase beta chain, mitochondrial-like [Palaemon carinicauda]|uniref:methylcrotonoyl-CoA carboxylase beta chain, mitochondrial-like n=1 Tax=Palaemon carinicauda TaxID=392227 RepID=UPI0035B67E6C